MVGSLRKNSYNCAALRPAQGLTPASAALTIFELDDLAKNSQCFVIFLLYVSYRTERQKTIQYSVNIFSKGSSRPDRLKPAIANFL